MSLDQTKRSDPLLAVMGLGQSTAERSRAEQGRAEQLERTSVRQLPTLRGALLEAQASIDGRSIPPLKRALSALKNVFISFVARPELLEVRASFDPKSQTSPTLTPSTSDMTGRGQDKRSIGGIRSKTSSETSQGKASIPQRDRHVWGRGNNVHAR